MITCPICLHKAQEFLPFGIKERKNAKCPKCGSLERHRLLWLFLKKELGFFRGRGKVLHFSPAACLREPLSAKIKRRYLTSDLQSPLFDYQSDLTDLPFDDNAFQTIIASHILEHIEKDRDALSEIRRVLEPDGVAIIMVPMWQKPTYEDPEITSRGPEARQKAYGHPDHVRWYGTDTLFRFRSSGLSVAPIRHSDFLKTDHFKRYSLCNETIFVCSKKKVT